MIFVKRTKNSRLKTYLLKAAYIADSCMYILSMETMDLLTLERTFAIISTNRLSIVFLILAIAALFRDLYG